MKGANEYCNLFRKEQFGKLYLYPSSHARGPTFSIWMLPSGEKPKDHDGGPWCVKDSVEVYGMISGQRGWTESYGWIHRGPWVDDFAAIVSARKIEIEEKNKQRKKLQAERDVEARDKLSDILSKY